MRYPKTSKTRPTTDKVREAIFNVLGPVGGTVVLDLFAGTGAMAIEALSRGAQWAEFVESDREARAVLRWNLENLGLSHQATVWAMPVCKALPKLGSTFDIVLADPPYDFGQIDEVMDLISRSDVLAPDGTMVLEHGKRFEPHEAYGKLRRRVLKRYGDTSVSIYEWGD